MRHNWQSKINIIGTFSVILSLGLNAIIPSMNSKKCLNLHFVVISILQKHDMVFNQSWSYRMVMWKLHLATGGSKTTLFMIIRQSFDSKVNPSEYFWWKNGFLSGIAVCKPTEPECWPSRTLQFGFLLPEGKWVKQQQETQLLKTSFCSRFSQKSSQVGAEGPAFPFRPFTPIWPGGDFYVSEIIRCESVGSEGRPLVSSEQKKQTSHSGTAAATR